jgi:putative FmdB family regulatory protein
MPFYEYECSKCGYQDEVLQKITDQPLTKCPSCGKQGLKKLVSAPVFRLKGSGWYETDFKSDQEKKRNLAAAEKEETKSEDKKDTKPEAKPDAKPETAAKPEKTEKADNAKPKVKPVKVSAPRKPAAKPKPARKARR